MSGRRRISVIIKEIEDDGQGTDIDHKISLKALCVLVSWDEDNMQHKYFWVHAFDFMSPQSWFFVHLALAQHVQTWHPAGARCPCPTHLGKRTRDLSTTWKLEPQRSAPLTTPRSPLSSHVSISTFCHRGQSLCLYLQRQGLRLWPIAGKRLRKCRLFWVVKRTHDHSHFLVDFLSLSLKRMKVW